MTCADALMGIFGLKRAPSPPTVIDRRKYATQAHGPKRQWKVRGRSWEDVRGICLHQTACLLGERDERWDSVGAHVGITRGGKEIWLHDWNRRVVHGNAWNEQTVGIEVDGLYAGVEGRIDTVWDNPDTPIREQPTTLTPEAVTATCNAIRRICADVEAHGGKVRVIVAHRQSSKTRRNDPGEAIWRAVALPMMAELGLGDGGPGFAIGGRPIPVEWDQSRGEWKY